MKRALLVSTLFACLTLPRAAGQCVMCYRTAEGQNQARARALNKGILILGVPPFLILTGFVIFIFRRDKV